MLFERNRAWAAGRLREDPHFFDRLADQQSPKYMWIGCSDSRVPANQITGLDPGEVFVHRNVANVVVQTDLNLLSVLQFAVEVLKVEHVIVCGHYGCGGVKAALENQRFGLIDNWLRQIQIVRDEAREELAELEGEGRFDRMCELNVLAQARNVSKTTVIQDAWQRHQQVDVHSWIYGLGDGLLRNLDAPIRE